MITKRVIIIASIIVCICIAVFALINRGKDDSATQIQTTAVTTTTFIKSVQSSGKTKAKKSAELRFQTSGKLMWVGVAEGDSVTAYQAIARLDSREVEKNLQKALTSYSAERNDFEETWRVTYDGKSPDNAFTDTVKRILQKNQWNLDQAVYDVELRHLALEFATLVTPISGIVTRIDTPVAGVNISPTSAVFEVADPSSLVFEANIDEIDVGNLAIGQPASIALDAFPDATFSGKVSYISYSSVLSGGGATVFPVQVTFNKPESLRIGLNGDVTITSLTKPDVVVIPIEAIREDGGKKYVYRKSQATYTKAYITVEEQNDSQAIIKSGISPGDEVVIKGFSNIHGK